MNANMDRYTQLSVVLSADELVQLEKNGSIDGIVWRTTDDNLPLKISLSDTGWRAQGLPQDVPYENKQCYEIDMPRDGIAALRSGRQIGAGYPTISLRYIYFCTDTGKY